MTMDQAQIDYFQAEIIKVSKELETIAGALAYHQKEEKRIPPAIAGSIASMIADLAQILSVIASYQEGRKS